MAKCVGSVNQWPLGQLTHLDDAKELLVGNVRQGEAAIKENLKTLGNQLMLEIASNFIKIKQAALGDDEFVLDSRQIQDKIVDQLKDLLDRTASTIQSIDSASCLVTSTKHGYFIQYTYGMIEKIQQLCQTVGRLSEIDQKLYMEEHRKLLVSDQSITIHSLMSIWTLMLEVQEDFCRRAESVFNGPPASGEMDLDEGYDFLDELEFSTARNTTAKIILMDLLITSWIKFNRLVKYDDLVRSIPFLCPCQMKTFFRILEGVSEWLPPLKSQDLQAKKKRQAAEKVNEQTLCDLISFILEPDRKLSTMTMSVRRPNIVPMEPCYSDANKCDLGYFIIWHLHCLSSRLKGDTIGRRMLVNCKFLMEKALKLVIESFIGESTTRRLSPHQEERYRLLFHMLNVWCEQNAGDNHNAILLNHLFEFAHSIDSLTNLETKYFNNSDVCVEDSLTLFQLSAKLMSETVPTMCTPEGQATQQAAENETKLTDEQKRLVATWNLLVDKHVHNKDQPPEKSTNSTASG